ncbi:hypothetical protein QTN25_008194 [Entamoeba marina]
MLPSAIETLHHSSTYISPDSISLNNLFQHFHFKNEFLSLCFVKQNDVSSFGKVIQILKNEDKQVIGIDELLKLPFPYELQFKPQLLLQLMKIIDKNCCGELFSSDFMMLYYFIENLAKSFYMANITKKDTLNDNEVLTALMFLRIDKTNLNAIKELLKLCCEDIEFDIYTYISFVVFLFDSQMI